MSCFWLHRREVVSIAIPLNRSTGEWLAERGTHSEYLGDTLRAWEPAAYLLGEGLMLRMEGGGLRLACVRLTRSEAGQ